MVCPPVSLLVPCTVFMLCLPFELVYSQTT